MGKEGRSVCRRLLVWMLVLACCLSFMLPAAVAAQDTPAATYRQVTDLTKLSAEKEYLIVCWRSFGGTEADSSSGYVFHSTNDGTLRAPTADHYATVTCASGAFADEALWKITAVTGGYQLQNVGTKKYLGAAMPDKGEAVAAESADAATLTIAAGTSGGYADYAIGTASSAVRYSGSGGKFSFGGSAPATEASGTNACNITIYEVVKAEPVKVTPTYQRVADLTKLSAEKEYLIVCWRNFGGTEADSSSGYVFHSTNDGTLRAPTADHYATVTCAGGAFADEALWKITAVTGGYQLQNVGTKKYLGATIPADAESAGAATLTIASGTAAGYSNFVIGTADHYIRYSGSESIFQMKTGAPSAQTSGTNACNITIYEVTAGTAPAAQSDYRIFFASDYQGGTRESNLTSITNAIQTAGVTPDLAVWCGDYVDGSVYADGSDTSLTDMNDRLGHIKSVMTADWPKLQYRCIQGNHDNSSFVKNGPLDATGAYEYDAFHLYLINEDDFPWWQGVNSDYANSTTNKATVEATASKLNTYLQGLAAAHSTKPVLIATHVPLHWSDRSTTGTSWWSDNIYAKTLFDVVNSAAQKMDIVVLFGHNHSGDYDNAIGGTVNYLGVGDQMRVPNGTTGTTNYTDETIHFTYMNAGYIGAVNSDLNPNVSTASIVTITNDEIKIDKYSASGLYAPASKVVKRNEYDKPVLTIAPKAGQTGTRTANGAETFAAALTNAAAATYAWSSGSANVQFTGVTNAAEAAVKYTAAGEAKITCTVTYPDAKGVSQTIAQTVTLAVAEASKDTAYPAIKALTDLSPDKKYVLVCWRYFGGSNTDSSKGYVLHGTNDGTLRAPTADHYATVTCAGGAFADEALWKIAAVKGGYTLQNVGTGKYLGTTLPASADSAGAAVLTIASGASGGYADFAIGTASSAIRYSGTKGTFSFGGSAPATEASGTNACNITIYEAASAAGKVDRTALEAGIAAAEKLAENDYTASTWAAVKTALAAAKAADASAAAKQENIEKALADLNGAVGALREKSAEASEKIDAIGKVSLSSGSAVEGARAAYDALSSAQKAKVTGYAKLLEAEIAYYKLVAASRQGAGSGGGSGASESEAVKKVETAASKYAKVQELEAYARGKAANVSKERAAAVEKARAAAEAAIDAAADETALQSALAAAKKAVDAAAGTARRFEDVADAAWYTDAVYYAADNSLFNGVSGTKFEPDGAMTRGMLTTVLYRLDGEPKTSGTSPFADASGAWYTTAVIWGSESGLVKGVGGGRFAPDDKVTREQIAVTLYRYASYKGRNVGGNADLSAFADADKVDGWARPAVAWANAVGLMNGRGGGAKRLDPAGNASRAEVAAMFMRFTQNVMK